MIKEKYKDISEKKFIPIDIFKENYFNNIYEINKSGEIRKIGSTKILKHNPSPGYPTVTLYSDGRRKSIAVHIILAKIFLENENPNDNRSVR